MNERNQLSWIDIISVASFLVGVANLDENLTQNDKQDLQKDLASRADALLAEIHAHLQKQDDKIDEILKEVKKNDR